MFVIFCSVIARVFLLIFLRVANSIVTTFLTHTVITRVIRVTSFTIRHWINMCRGCFLICHRRRWNQNVPISVCLQHGAIVQLWLYKWLIWLLLLHLNLLRILLFWFRLDLLWVFLHLNLWLELLRFLLNILKTMARGQPSKGKAPTSALARGHVGSGHLLKQN
jgi:hypothetical protein